MPNMSIALIGYRGSGKSQVAPRVAERLGWSWIDADDEIERRAGQSIAEIFAKHGEPAFRDLESQVLADLAARPQMVLALGGGAVLRPANRQVLVDNQCAVVWLKASAETLWQRISADTTTSQRRPNLTSGGGLGEVENLLAQREPLYAESAQLSVDTEGKSPGDVAREIVEWHRARWPGV